MLKSQQPKDAIFPIRRLRKGPSGMCYSYRGMNSNCVRDKFINFINNDNGELTINFLMQHLEIEDSNSHHKSLSQLDSTTSINFAAYDCRQNKESKYNKNQKNGKHLGQKPGGDPKSSNSSRSSRIPSDMEEKCMKCGKQKHQQGQKCAATHQKCKVCGKMGHFARVCMTTRSDTSTIQDMSSCTRSKYTQCCSHNSSPCAPISPTSTIQDAGKRQCIHTSRCT